MSKRSEMEIEARNKAYREKIIAGYIPIPPNLRRFLGDQDWIARNDLADLSVFIGLAWKTDAIPL